MKDNWFLLALAALTLAGHLITGIPRYCLAIVKGMTINPILTALAALILATVVVVGLTLSFYGYGGNFLENILVEGHGMLLDILVIGIFILWLNRLGEKRLEIRRYQEEIDDFRGWHSDEAAHRIAGSIKRLNRKGIANIELNHCYLGKVNLSRVNLRGARLFQANLRGANLSGADLRSGDLYRANLSSADLSHVNLRTTDLRRVNLSGANLSRADLTGAKEWANEQLAQAESLVGATMPDGRVMAEEAWEEFKKQYQH